MKNILVLVLLIIFCVFVQAQTLSEKYFLGKYEEVVNISPENETDFVLIGQSFEELMQPDSAQQIYRVGLRQYPQSRVLKIRLAKIYEENGDFDNAEFTYKELYNNDSSDLKAVHMLAQFYMGQERARDAIQIYKATLNRGEISPQIYEKLADAYGLDGESEMVLDCFQKALELDSANLRIASEVVKWEYILKRYPQAELLAHKYLMFDSSNIILNKILGLSLAQQAKFSEAIPHLEFYYNKGTHQDYVLRSLALCHFYSRNYKRTIKLCNEYNKKEDPEADVDFILGVSLRETGDSLTSLVYLTRALDNLKPDPKKMGLVVYELANNYRVVKNFEKALEYYRIGYEADPEGQRQCLFFAGSVLLNDMNNKKEALKEFRRFLSVVPEDSNTKGGMTITLRGVALKSVEKITEELFLKEGEESIK